MGKSTAAVCCEGLRLGLEQEWDAFEVTAKRIRKLAQYLLKAHYMSTKWKENLIINYGYQSRYLMSLDPTHSCNLTKTARVCQWIPSAISLSHFGVTRGHRIHVRFRSFLGLMIVAICPLQRKSAPANMACPGREKIRSILAD